MPTCCQSALLAQHCCFSWKALTAMAFCDKRVRGSSGERGENFINGPDSSFQIWQWANRKTEVTWVKPCLGTKSCSNAKPLCVSGQPPASECMQWRQPMDGGIRVPVVSVGSASGADGEAGGRRVGTSGGSSGKVALAKKTLFLCFSLLLNDVETSTAGLWGVSDSQNIPSDQLILLSPWVCYIQQFLDSFFPWSNFAPPLPYTLCYLWLQLGYLFLMT